MCVIWNTDVGHMVKYSTLLMMHTRRTSDSSDIEHMVKYSTLLMVHTRRTSDSSDVEHMVKYSTLLMVHTRRTCNSSWWRVNLPFTHRANHIHKIQNVLCNVVLRVNINTVICKNLGQACVESKYFKNGTFDQNETNTIEIYTLCLLW